MTRIIINIVGQAGSGKSSVCVDLTELGFEIYRPSDVIRAFAAEHGISLQSRQDYVAVHQQIIATDPLAIIRPVLQSNAERIVLDGMRAPAPFLELKKQLNTQLIFLECPPTIRLERILADNKRSGHRQVTSLESLLADEAVDEINPNPNLPNMLEMTRLADYTIDASKPLPDVLREVRSIATNPERVNP